MGSKRSRRGKARLKNEEVIQKKMGGKSRPRKKAKTPSRPFKISGSGKLDTLLGDFFKGARKPVLDQLGLTRDAFKRALLEVERRLKSEKAPHNVVYGTFIEVVCAIHPDIIEFRQAALKTNLQTAVFAAAIKAECFFGLGADGSPTTHAIKLEDFPLTKPSKLTVPNRSAFRSDDAFQDALAKFTEEFAQLVDTKAIVHRADTKLGGVKYIDRTASLKLKNGQEIFLLTEEYKASRSGGGQAQSAVRIDRLIGDETVNAKTRFSGAIDDPDALKAELLGGKKPDGPSPDTAKPIEPSDRAEIDVSAIRVNMASFTQDQTLVKVTTGDSKTGYSPTERTMAYVKKKKIYGAKFRRGGRANEGLYRNLINFPTREIHALLHKLEQGLK